MTSFERMAESKPIREIAYETLKHAIITGEIPAGSRIVETDYAERMHISRTPLREALRKLEQDGLVEYVMRRGVIVRAFTVEDVMEIYTIRNALEMLTLPAIVEKATPADIAELRAMLRKAVTELEGPVAVRYPRGGEGAYQACSLEPVTVLREGSDLTLLTYGIVINDVLQAAELLAQQGISAEVVKLAQVAPLEAAPVLASLQKTGRLLAVEDVCAANCIGEQVLSAAEQAGMPMKEARLLNLGSGIIPHGAPDVLKTAYGLDAQAIAAAAQALCANDREKGNGA